MDGRKALAKAFGDYVDSRGLTQTDVAAMGGPSTTSQTKIRTTDEPLSRQTLQKLDAVMGWATGTSARIIAGSAGPTGQRTIEQFSNAELADEVRRRLLLGGDETNARSAEAGKKTLEPGDPAEEDVTPLIVGVDQAEAYESSRAVDPSVSRPGEQ